MSPGAVRRLDIVGLVVMLLTLVMTIVWAFPLVWSIATTMAPQRPGGTFLDFVSLYGHVLFETQIGRWYLNSLITAGGTKS